MYRENDIHAGCTCIQKRMFKDKYIHIYHIPTKNTTGFCQLSVSRILAFSDSVSLY